MTYDPSREIFPENISSSERQRRRINLINRRTVAWLIESSLVSIFFVPFISVYLISHFPRIIIKYDGSINVWAYLALVYIVWIIYYCVRDIIGGSSFGKKLVGLRLIAKDNKSRVIRNLPLIIPFMQIVEYLIAYSPQNPKMQRYGDKLADTYVIDVKPDRYGHGTWSGQMMLAFFFYYLVNSGLGEYITMLYFRLLSKVG